MKKEGSMEQREKERMDEREQIYQNALLLMEGKLFAEAADQFARVPDYRDADRLRAECEAKKATARLDDIYEEADKAAANRNVRSQEKAIRIFERIRGHRDADERIEEARRTIEETGKKAGMLQIVMERPRKNQTKLLLLMDSGGSMWSYTDLCSRIFNAVHQSNHFKDLQIYYFHNCVYDEVYKTPECLKKDSVPTQWLLDNLKPEYKVIYVGDASMAPAELYDRASGFDYFRYDSAHYMNDFVTSELKEYQITKSATPTRDKHF